MIVRALIILLIPSLAFATGPNWQYIVGTGATPCASLTAANAAYASALGTDSTTPYWFPLIILTNGTCAIKIVPGDQYYGTTVALPLSAKFPSGLTLTLSSSNISQLNVALATRASLAGLLPDVLTLAEIEAILTTQQINQLNNISQSAHPTLYADWQTIKAGGVVDMSDPTYLDLVNQGLSLGLITQAEYTQLTTPVVTTEGP